MELVAQGYDNDAIAAELELTPYAARAVVSAIYDKLGVRNLTGRNPRVLAVLAYLEAGNRVSARHVNG